MKNEKKRIRISTVILIILIVILSVAVAVSLFVIDRLNKNNMFSKSILLDSNYFLRQYADASSDDAEERGAVSEDEFVQALLKTVFGEKDYNEAIRIFDHYYDPQYVEEPAEGTPEAEIEAEIVAELEHNGERYETILVYREELYGILAYCNGINDDSINIIKDMLIDYTGNEDMYRTVLVCAGLIGGKKQIDIKYISQEGILPNGCESVSATMLLCHAGYETDPLDFVERHLDCSPVSIRFGCRYGPNPKYAYAGDPRSEDEGWGCFAPVIVKAINHAINGDGDARAVNLTGMPLNELCKRYIDRDIPVAIWGTVGMKEVSRILQWQSPDGSQSFLYPSNEHCLVLVGYDDDNYIFADPYESRGIVSYPREAVADAYAMLGSQAVAIVK